MQAQDFIKLKGIGRALMSWRRSCAATAAIEFTIIFPLMMTLFLGVYDMGNGIMANQKAIAASQTIADLVTRNKQINNALLQDILESGYLTMAPFETDEMGIDIISVSYDEGDLPQQEWRKTFNMTPDPDVLDNAENLGEEGDGVVMVTVTYTYHPPFSHMFIGDIEMEEISVARGRKTPVVEWSES